MRTKDLIVTETSRGSIDRPPAQRRGIDTRCADSKQVVCLWSDLVLLRKVVHYHNGAGKTFNSTA